MADLIAQLIRGKTSFGGEPERIIERADGMRGMRHYLVPTDDVERALEAIGLPEVDGPWSQTRQDLLCVQREPVYIGGSDDPATGVGGNTLVKCDFETPGTGGRLPPPEEGSNWCEAMGAESTFTRYYDVRVEDDSDTYGTPLVNGRGASVAYGTTALRVTVFPRSNEVIPLKRMMQLARKHSINKSRIITPKTRVGRVQWILDPGQVQYRTYEVGIENGLVKITHIIEIAEDFDLIWYQEDSRGNAITGFKSRVYPHEEFGGLWPGIGSGGGPG